MYHTIVDRQVIVVLEFVAGADAYNIHVHKCVHIFSYAMFRQVTILTRINLCGSNIIMDGWRSVLMCDIDDLGPFPCRVEEDSEVMMFGRSWCLCESITYDLTYLPVFPLAACVAISSTAGRTILRRMLGDMNTKIIEFYSKEADS